MQTPFRFVLTCKSVKYLSLWELSVYQSNFNNPQQTIIGFANSLCTNMLIFCKSVHQNTMRRFKISKDLLYPPIGSGCYWTSRENSSELIELSSIKKVSLVWVCSCSNTRSIRDDSYWTSRKNCLELIELSSKYKVTLV